MRHVGVVVMVSAVLACSSEKTGGRCDSSADCGGGQICRAGTCEAVCTGDGECGSGEICQASVCIPGSRDLPVIETIDGDSSEDSGTCPGVSAGKHCIELGLVVTGQNFSGGTWQLQPTAGDPLALATLTDSTATRAHLGLPLDLIAGGYVLSVANGAGSADQAVTVLQGLPGADGSADTAADILAKLLTVDGASSGLDADLIDGTELVNLTTQLDSLQTQIDALTGGGGGPPAGSIVAWGGATAPAGWVLCDGGTYDSTDSNYTALYGAIGCGYGCAGQDFSVPDLQERFPMGRAPSGAASTLGASGGAFDHDHSQPGHAHFGATHQHTGPDHSHSVAAHAHGLNNHNHSLSSHSHGIGHTHDIASHSHSVGSHTHPISNHNHRWSYVTTAESLRTFNSAGSNIQLISHSPACLSPGGCAGYLSFAHPDADGNITTQQNWYTENDGSGATGVASPGTTSALLTTGTPSAANSGAPSTANTGSSTGNTATATTSTIVGGGGQLTGSASGNTGSGGDDTTGTSNAPYVVVNYIIKL